MWGIISWNFLLGHLHQGSGMTQKEDPDTDLEPNQVKLHVFPLLYLWVWVRPKCKETEGMKQK